MIEHNRDEEVCRRWEFLADKDHTYHFSEQEYFYYKNKWWLFSNKSGSSTPPLRNRSDFQQALSTLERLQQDAGEEPYVPTFSYKHNDSWLRVHLLHGGIGKIPVVFIKFRKSRRT